MQPLPFPLRLSLLASSCATIVSGLALAGATFGGSTGGIAAAATVFLLAAAGGPLLIARQVGLPPRERQDPTAGHPAPEEEARDAAGHIPPDEAASTDDEEAVRRTRKAQAVDRLRDGITHDLNNRLMVISANIDAVARQMKDQPTLQRKLLSALVASDQAAKLIAKSSAFARQGENGVQYVDLAERIGSIAALMGRSLLRDTVELRLSLDEGLWPVEADPDDIETAIVTLSAYVRDALTQGGAITLEARNMHLKGGSLPDPKLEGEFVQLVIRSAGWGAAPQPAGSEAGRAPLFRDVEVSSWLNASQSLHFLQAIGGASEVRRSGAEAAIVLYLPRACAATLLPSGLSDDDDMMDEDVQDHTEILVVDDEVEVAMALQSMLEEFGYVTRVATSAKQAMKSLNARKPGLVLTDVAMPGTMNGAMLAREVRLIFPDLPILLITGSPVVAGEESEFPLLQKPIIGRDLHAVIQRHLMPADENKIVPLFPRAS